MRPGELPCGGCSHGHDCRVIPCADCTVHWHHLGHIPDPFICPRCDEVTA